MNTPTWHQMAWGFISVALALALLGVCLMFAGCSNQAPLYTAQDLCAQYVDQQLTAGKITIADAMADSKTLKAGGIPARCANLPSATAGTRS